MRKALYLLLAITLFLKATNAQNKLGLVVAVGKYPEGGRWKNLSSANDLIYIKASLQKNGFAEQNINVLQDEKATKNGILKALDELHVKSNAGDIVIFHFSGHGQQIADDNGDEADGYDEALIAYDAKAIYDPVSYTGQNHLRDDELGEKLAAIRNKIGAAGSLVVVLDACHSGTATRGNEFAICRGEPVPFQSPGYKPKNILTAANIGKEPDGYFASPKETAANMIVFSASSPSQVNYETKDQNNAGVGSLSYAFAKALSDLKKGSDYRLLFEKIKSQIQANYPMQIPLVEGKINQEIFSGNYVTRPEVIAVQKWLNDSTFLINVGSLNSIQSGSGIKILAPGSATPLAEGYVKQVSTFQSICVSKKPLSKSDAYEVQMDAVNNGAFAASLFIKNTADKPGAGVEKQLTNFIKSYKFLSLNNNADFMLDITKTAGGSKLSLVEKGDSIRWVKNLNKGDTLAGADLTSMLDDIKKAMRIKYFRTMSDGGSLANNIQVQVVPAAPSPDPDDLVMKPLSLFNIVLTNNSANNVYYTIIDLMPDNEVKVLLPTDSEEPQDRYLRAGETYTISDIEVDEHTPRGKEFFKVIFTKTPMDLRRVFERKTTRGSGNLQSFEQVIDDMFKDGKGAQATRSNIGNVKVDEVGIITKGFTIR
jgi:hypothetical protein